MNRYCKTLLLGMIMLYSAGVFADDTLPKQAQETMKKATNFLHSITTKGGYAGIFSLDLSQRWGEEVYEPASPNEIWIQPPGTPSIGTSFIKAYKATRDEEYLKLAKEAGLALAWAQSTHGGWIYLVDLSRYPMNDTNVKRVTTKCTFDDDVSQGAVTFLMDLDEVIDEPWLTDAINLSLNHIMSAQYENGGWPQWYPLIGGYHDYYTFNDGAMNDCIRVMLKAYKQYGRKDCFESAKKGGDFIILSQLQAPQTGWGQQYSLDLKPAWARKFEPPGLESAVTAQNITTLITIYEYTQDEKYLKPIPLAIDWLERSKIGDNLWARLYEIGTNRPIFGDYDSKVHYTFEELSEDRQTGYSWRISWPLDAIEAYNTFMKKRAEQGTVTPGQLENARSFSEASAPQEREVKQIIASLDNQGRWVNQKRQLIFVDDFVNNMNRLCLYIESQKK
jgi:hypothetical protein